MSFLICPEEVEILSSAGNSVCRPAVRFLPVMEWYTGAVSGEIWITEKTKKIRHICIFMENQIRI